jgi:hypothetical protein
MTNARHILNHDNLISEVEKYRNSLIEVIHPRWNWPNITLSSASFRSFSGKTISSKKN